MKPRRFSVIDIGTNSARFLAAELGEDGSWSPIADRREPCRLGEGVTKGGSLGGAPMDRAVAAVASFVAAAEEHRAPIARAVATYAVRKAGNRDQFLATLKEKTGVELEIIGPREEGMLSFRAVAEAMGAGAKEGKPQRIGVVDTGGGSVQLTVGVGDVAVASISMPLGAVAMTELFADGKGADRFEDLRDHVAKVIEESIQKLPFLPRRLYGVGGGCTSAALLGLQRAAGVLVPGGSPVPMPPAGTMNISAAEVRELLRVIRPLSLAERSALPSLSVERSQIIVAGLAVIEGVLSRLPPHSMTTMTVGLRDGLVVSAAERQKVLRDARSPSPRAMLPAAAARLSERCRSPQPHTNHVRTLAAMLHAELAGLAERDAVKGGRWSRPRGASMLSAAALLHDAGIVVEYKGHHKHSEAIVRLNGLCGVRQRFTDVVAAIARYHRRAMPSKKHEVYGSLDRKGRRQVRALAGILRVADGLDRSHGQVVTGLRVLEDKEGLAIVVSSTPEPKAEIAAASEKSDLLARVLGKPITVRWAGSATETAKEQQG